MNFYRSHDSSEVIGSEPWYAPGSMFHIAEQRGSRLRVALVESFAPPSQQRGKALSKNPGWIAMSSVMTNVNMSEAPAVLQVPYPVPLQSSPDPGSSVVHIFRQETVTNMEVLGCRDTWIQVRVRSDAGDHIGWLGSDHHCGNPATTCPF